jgi:hypothetical protein
VSRARLPGLLCGIVGAVLAVNAVSTAFWLHRGKAEQRLHLGRDFVDHVSRIDASLRPLRPRLAAREYVWYVADPPNNQLFEVQYAIVPTVLQWRTPRPPGKTFVLANFPTSGALDAFLEKLPHELRWRQGGMALLRQR